MICLALISFFVTFAEVSEVKARVKAFGEWKLPGHRWLPQRQLIVLVIWPVVTMATGLLLTAAVLPKAINNCNNSNLNHNLWSQHENKGNCSCHCHWYFYVHFSMQLCFCTTAWEKRDVTPTMPAGTGQVKQSVARCHNLSHISTRHNTVQIIKWAFAMFLMAG